MGRLGRGVRPLNTLRARSKPGQIERDPRVEIVVYNAENPYQHVRIAGRAELVDEGAEEHIDKLSQKYVGEECYRGGPRATGA